MEMEAERGRLDQDFLQELFVSSCADRSSQLTRSGVQSQSSVSRCVHM